MDDWWPTKDSLGYTKVNSGNDPSWCEHLYTKGKYGAIVNALFFITFLFAFGEIKKRGGNARIRLLWTVLHFDALELCFLPCVGQKGGAF